MVTHASPKPEWSQHDIKEDSWDGLDFSTWNKLAHWLPQANLYLLDTTELSLAQVTQSMVDWIDS